MESLAGRTALVTGGTGLLGQAIVRDLARAGASVHVGYHRSADTAASLVTALTAEGARCAAHQMELGSDQGCADAIASVAKEDGRLDIVVHAAGTSRVKLLTLSSSDDVEREFALNALGAVHCVRHALRTMTKQRWGRIVLIGTRATVGAAGMALYAASKSSLIGLVAGAAKEAAKQGVTVNLISPGRIEGSAGTEGPERQAALTAYPMGRFVHPHEVAALVRFLATEGAAAITGQNIFVTAGA